jgi:hypothetical protein
MTNLFRLDDPVTKEALTLMEGLVEWVYGVSDAAIDHATMDATLDEIAGLQEDLAQPGPSRSGLDNLLDTLPTILSLGRSVQQQMTDGAILGRFVAPTDAEQPDLLALRFEALEGVVKAVTPLQLAVQRHFSFLTHVHTQYALRIDELAALAIAPLAACRDDFFLRPHEALIVRYLQTVEQFMQTPYYRNRVRAMTPIGHANHRRRLEEALLELELASMLGSIQAPVAADFNPEEGEQDGR